MENKDKQKITTPTAIIVAGFLIMIAILVTKSGGTSIEEDKTLSGQVGVSKDKLTQCIEATDKTELQAKIQVSVDDAMSGVPQDQRGTPYSIIIGKNGVMTEVRGADSYENVKKLIDEVTSGTVTNTYTGKITLEEDDHLVGNPDAAVVIVEYSDYECPYCKIFHKTLEKIVTESNGNVAWIYRHWPIHQFSFDKLVAAECVDELEGNDAFWEYSELLFGLLDTGEDTVSDQL